MNFNKIADTSFNKSPPDRQKALTIPTCCTCLTKTHTDFRTAYKHLLNSQLRYSRDLAEPKCHKTLTGCLAKTGLDQHLKLSCQTQSHILFLKVFFEKKHSKCPQTNILGRNSFKSPQALIFSLIPPFSKFGTALPPAERGGLTLYTDCPELIVNKRKMYDIAKFLFQ